MQIYISQVSTEHENFESNSPRNLITHDILIPSTICWIVPLALASRTNKKAIQNVFKKRLKLLHKTQHSWFSFTVAALNTRTIFGDVVLGWISCRGIDVNLTSAAILHERTSYHLLTPLQDVRHLARQPLTIQGCSKWLSPLPVSWYASLHTPTPVYSHSHKERRRAAPPTLLLLQPWNLHLSLGAWMSHLRGQTGQRGSWEAYCWNLSAIGSSL